MSPSEDLSHTAQTLASAATKLGDAINANVYPELQSALMHLASSVKGACDQTENDESRMAQVVALDDSIVQLYRVSQSQLNAAPQKYQQPIFQCYNDYTKCIKKKSKPAERLVCQALFALSIANCFVSITFTKKM